MRSNTSFSFGISFSFASCGKVVNFFSSSSVFSSMFGCLPQLKGPMSFCTYSRN